MIPRGDITKWQTAAPWAATAQVEQDLILCRAVVDIFSDPFLATHVAFRGGTALHKLFLHPPARYSEDIDLVQVRPGPIGDIVNALHVRLDPWLGKPQWKAKEGRFVLYYRFDSETPPIIPMRVKIEINTREHFSAFGTFSVPFRVDNPWYQGETRVLTYALEELLGTKFRALYQRKKGRDLFDLWLASHRALVDPSRVVEAFLKYVEHDEVRVSRAEFEANLTEKVSDPVFRGDIGPLLAPGLQYSIDQAAMEIMSALVSLLPGDPWKGGGPEK